MLGFLIHSFCSVALELPLLLRPQWSLWSLYRKWYISSVFPNIMYNYNFYYTTSLITVPRGFWQRGDNTLVDSDLMLWLDITVVRSVFLPIHENWTSFLRTVLLLWSLCLRLPQFGEFIFIWFTPIYFNYSKKKNQGTADLPYRYAIIDILEDKAMSVSHTWIWFWVVTEFHTNTAVNLFSEPYFK